MIGIDELSSFKSPKSQRYKALRKIKAKLYFHIDLKKELKRVFIKKYQIYV